MGYDLDRLGWLQFQQLCAHVLELDAGVSRAEWQGDADETRTVIVDSDLGPPLLDAPVRGRVLVQCAWLRPGSLSPLTGALGHLSVDRLDDVRSLSSYVLMANGTTVRDRPQPDIKGLSVEVIDNAALSARIDARPDLRLAMPSVLGLRALGDLIPAALDRWTVWPTTSSGCRHEGRLGAPDLA